MNFGLIALLLSFATVLGQQQHVTSVIEPNDSSNQYSLRASDKTSHLTVHRKLDIGDQWSQFGQDIDGDNTNDKAGKAVDISGDGATIVFGAIQGVGNIGSGYIRVYKRDGQQWNQLGQDINGDSDGDLFGASVSLSDDGETLIVAAASAGYVRVYKYHSNGNSWNQIGNDLDGAVVSMSADGNTVATGEPSLGRVRVYEYDAGLWNQKGLNLEGSIGVDFGYSIDLSSDGNILAVGAPMYSFGLGTVRIFEFDDAQTQWNQLGQGIDGEGGGFGGLFGFDVSLSANGLTVAAGAPEDNGNGWMSGHAQIYKYDGSQWNQLGGDINADSAIDQAGYAVSLSSDGETIAVGAPQDSNGSDARSGHVRVFNFDGAQWNQVGQDINGEEAFDSSGDAISISADGRTVAIGAYKNDNEDSDCTSGHVRVFELPSRSPAGSNGDPHFKTWANEHYEYHGQCDLVLAKDEQFADGLGIDIHIRTKLVRYWSFIKSAVIRIGNDILEVEGYMKEGIHKELHYWMNYEYQGEVEDLAGFPVTIQRDKWDGTKFGKNHFEIDLSSKYPDQKIVITTLKEFVRVDFLNPTAAAFGKTVGMLGDYKTGRTLARDGSTVLDDFTALGHEWQVLPSDAILFHEITSPQFPAKCVDSEDPRGERRRRLQDLSISEEQAEAACAGLRDALDRKDCVYDVLTTQDMDMAGAF